MSRRFAVLALLFALALVAAGCGSSSKPAASTDNSANNNANNNGTTVPGGGSGTTDPGDASSGGGTGDLPDPCSLLEDADVQAALGASAAGKAAGLSSKEGDPDYDGCSWGELTSDNGLIGVQISKPSGDAGIDIVETKFNASKSGKTLTPVDIGENGQLIDLALVPYGGGVGYSVYFTKNGTTVLVGMTKGDEAKVKAAAQAVADNL